MVKKKISQKSRFKKAAKDCKGKKDFRGCMSRKLKKKK